MTLILDAFNILHAWHSSPASDTWTQIVALGTLTRRGPWAGSQAILVCDGPSPDRDRPEIEILPTVSAVFSGPESDADSLIERLIARSTTPTRLTVVSSDRRVERAARRRGCRAISAPEFLRLTLGAPRPPATDDAPSEALDASEIDRWMRAFGVDPGGAAPRPPAPAPTKHPPSEDARLLDRARIDPAELDMEKWLRMFPPPDPDMEPHRPSD